MHAPALRQSPYRQAFNPSGHQHFMDAHHWPAYTVRVRFHRQEATICLPAMHQDEKFMSLQVLPKHIKKQNIGANIPPLSKNTENTTKLLSQFSKTIDQYDTENIIRVAISGNYRDFDRGNPLYEQWWIRNGHDSGRGKHVDCLSQPAMTSSVIPDLIGNLIKSSYQCK